MNINDNNNINISALTTDDFIFSEAIFFCKILNIPKDFIFVDKIDKIEIENGQYLRAQNNEIVFKQYKKNTNAIFILQGIMFANFKNNTYEIFPSNSDIPKDNKIIYEGNKIQLNISINICNNGFYEIENKYGICSNSRPDGYYLDVKNNIFKKCHNKCSYCITGSNDDSNMMCLKCIKGYTYDPNTYNCISNKKDIKEVDIEMEVEKNPNFWLFIALFFFSLVIGIIFFLIKPCKKKEKNIASKENIKSEENERKNSLISLDEIKNILPED